MNSFKAIKILLESSEHDRAVQEELVRIRYSWGQTQTFMTLFGQEPDVYIHSEADGSLWWNDGIDEFMGEPAAEVTLEQLKRMEPVERRRSAPAVKPDLGADSTMVSSVNGRATLRLS